jgi:hypothetical protein
LLDPEFRIDRRRVKEGDARSIHHSPAVELAFPTLCSWERGVGGAHMI